MGRATILLSLLAACAPPPPQELPENARDAPPSSEAWSYRVELAAARDRLSVEAAIGGGSALEVDEAAAPFVRALEVRTAAGWKRADGWQVAECEEGCSLRYEFALGEAALALDDVEVAARRGQALLSSPSAWLLRPERERSVPYRFAVRCPPGVEFVSGVWRRGDGYGGQSGDLWRSPYSAFGSFDDKSLAIGGGTVELAIVEGELDAAAVARWIDRAAGTVSDYFGRFPVPRVLVLASAARGDRIHGLQMGGGGASILLSVGREAGEDDFARDWVAVHEMIHLGVPAMARRHLWLTEGLATYLEPLARARRGDLAVETVWRGMVWGMPHGLPEEGDRGLDGTPTWGRIYWGGALFAMLADIEIRKQTGGRRSLDDALRAVVDRGGHNGVWWSIERFLSVADEATGTRVLRELYGKMARAPHPIDLPALWRELGVVGRGRALRFDDRAPLAALRRALTEPK